MKRVNIKAMQKGFVIKNDRILNILSEGKHWIPWNSQVEVHSVLSPLTSVYQEQLIWEIEKFRDQLQLVKVEINELMFMWIDGQFKSVLTPGYHLFWNSEAKRDFKRFNTEQTMVPEAITKSMWMLTEVQPYVRMYTVENYEKGLMYEDGKLARTLESGIYVFWKNAIVIQVYKVDLRKQQMEINGQEILTRDKASLRINFSMQYQLVDIMQAVVNKEYERQLYVMAQLGLREQVAILTLDELLDKREALSESILAVIGPKAETMGCKVLDCGIRDIILPGDVKDIMNQVLVAEKRAQANVIMRREETASTRSLLNTAKLMEENTMLYKLKEMEYVEKIAEKINTISVNGSGDLIGQLKQIFTK